MPAGCRICWAVSLSVCWWHQPQPQSQSQQQLQLGDDKHDEDDDDEHDEDGDNDMLFMNGGSNSDSEKNEVIFIRYDDINLKYIYVCCKCDLIWKL